MTDPMLTDPTLKVPLPSAEPSPSQSIPTGPSLTEPTFPTEAGTRTGTAARPGTKLDSAPDSPDTRRHRSAFLHSALPDAITSSLSMVAIALFALTFIAQPFRIPSASMEPTLLVGDFLLADKTIHVPDGSRSATRFGSLLPYRQIGHGDVIVFYYPPDPKIHVVKRIIGVPGDRIRLEDGILYLNGQAQRETYILPAAAVGSVPPQPFRDQFPPTLYTDPAVDPRWWLQLRRDVRNGEYVVPANSYFVLGDNRGNSRDSRYWGLVPKANIVGSPLLIYFSIRNRSSEDLPQIAPQTANDKLKPRQDAANPVVEFGRRHRIFQVVR